MTKISALSDIGTSVASNDTFVLVDVSDPTTPNKKIQQQNILAAGGLLPDGSAGTPGLRFTSDTNVGLFRPTTDTLGFATGGSERLRIDSSGRVGIGTASVASTLHIVDSSSAANGTIRLGGGSAFPGYNSTIQQDGQTTGKLLFNSAATAGTGHGHQFQVDGTAAVTIDASRRVGVGTTSPGYKLDVQDSINIRADGSSLANLYFSGTGTRIRSNDGTGNLSFFTNSAERAYVGYGGGFVILNALSVGGNVTLSGGDRSIINNDNNALAFGTNATERARIDSSGRLLVGTSSARSDFYNGSGNDARLQIEGDGSSLPGYILQSWVVNHNSATVTPHLVIGKSRGSANGSVTVVQNGDSLGHLDWHGADGTNMVVAASIDALVDGTPGANDMPGRLVFSTTADGGATPTERMRITSDAYVRLAAGTGGIQFNGDTAAANALDDYEEGTWTPNLTGSGGGAYTYGFRTGIYTKVGNTVTIHCAFEITGTTTPYSGNFIVDGLPYICRDVRAVGSMAPGSAITYSAPYTFVFPQTELNSSVFYIAGGNLNSTAITGATVSNGIMYGFSLTYKTS
jgi:hypothetical protein